MPRRYESYHEYAARTGGDRADYNRAKSDAECGEFMGALLKWSCIACFCLCFKSHLARVIAYSVSAFFMIFFGVTFFMTDVIWLAGVCWAFVGVYIIGAIISGLLHRQKMKEQREQLQQQSEPRVFSDNGNIVIHAWQSPPPQNWQVLQQPRFTFQQPMTFQPQQYRFQQQQQQQRFAVQYYVPQYFPPPVIGQQLAYRYPNYQQYQQQDHMWY